MGNDRRIYRVAQAIREQLATQLLASADERFELVTLTGVKVTKDLRLAKVYWVQSGPKERIKEISAAFEGARGFFRNGLANNMHLRFVPELRFYYDDTFDTVEKVSQLMASESLDSTSESVEEESPKEVIVEE